VDRKAEIDALFCRALKLQEELPEEEFARFLDAATEGDDELRQGVEGLLAASEAEDTLLHGDGAALGGLLLEAAAGSSGRTPDLLAGDRIGSFEITGELGRGGMAVVYRAQRVEGGFRQEVALKVLQRGLVTEDLLARFAQERQILAALNHPHIARLLEGGVTPDGRPYFAMEAIAGKPLDRYCDEGRLTVEERLRLFKQICHGVHHAHGRLVVHRDLKPANILVDDQGTLKLLDFGIAKLLDPAPLGGMAAPATRTAVRLLTPEYASPEQIRGEPVSTAADIYQLGLILYELLTGRRPHSLEGLSLLEAERLLEQRQPTRPSTAVTRSEGVASAASLSQARRTTPEHLRRRLKGDLDAIVLKALRLEPAQRYPSVDHLAEDIERFLEGRPVEARAGNTAYRANRFFRRHRLAVAAGLVVVASLTAYAVTATVQGQRVARERDLARSEAAKAEAVKGFLVDLFTAVDPATARGQEWTARELLDRGAERLSAQDLSAQPVVKAELLDTVGRVYRHLGAYPEAEGALADALLLRRAALRRSPADPLAHRELAETLLEAGTLALRQSDLPAAEAHLREALATLEGSGQGEGILAAMAAARLGAVIQEKGEYPAAAAQLRAALEAQRALLGEHHPEVGESLTRLARVVFFLGDLPAAERLQQQGIEALAGAHGADHPAVLEARMGLAFLRSRQGDLEGAQALLQETLEAARGVLGETHPLIGALLVTLGNVYQDGEEWDAAEAAYREAIALHRAVLGADHAEALAAVNDLGTMLLDKGDGAAAEPLLREALEGNLRRYGEDHPRVADNLYNLGTLYLRAGRYAEAEAAHRRCLAIREQIHDPGHLAVARSRATVGVIQVMAGPVGRASDAETQLRDGLAALRALGPPGEPHLPRALTALGWVLLDGNRPEEAVEFLREAVERRAVASPPDSPFLAEARVAYGQALRATGQEAAGAAAWREGMGVLEKVLAEDHWLRRRLGE
jgi:serine/threonine-protein kinase